MLEKEIEKKVITYASGKNIVSYKFTSPNNKGVPDRIFISSKGDVFFIEFKRKDKTPTKLQQAVIDKLVARHCNVYVVDDIVEGYKIIDGYHRLT